MTTSLDRMLVFSSNMPVDGMIAALWMEPFLNGAQPYSCGADLTEVPHDASLLPAAGTIEHTHETAGRVSHLATGPGWTLLAGRRVAGAVMLRVCAVSQELAREVLDETTATVAPKPVGDTSVVVDFWNDASCGGTGERSPRHIDVPTWTSVRANYGGAALPRLDRLMDLRPDALRGRLLLLHGPSGTGKTTALRALAHEWRSWCHVESVLDPERLLSDPGYLTSVVLGEHQRPDDLREPGSRWRMLVLEDCDELVGASAKEQSGQGLSRLLNLTDGMLGQGLEVLVCLTTNENVARLHPAVVRPGRCLAEIEVDRLTQDEASTWLGEPVGPEGATLAELYALRAERTEPGDGARLTG
jgi:hypothetical protein